MPTATVTSKGQITIPASVRTRFGLCSGSRIEFFEDEDGTLRMMPLTTDIASLFGILRRPGAAPLTLEDMDQAIAQGAAESAGLA
jgi:AbrB family looped-hinge helix DNA binding protein